MLKNNATFILRNDVVLSSMFAVVVLGGITAGTEQAAPIVLTVRPYILVVIAPEVSDFLVWTVV